MHYFMYAHLSTNSTARMSERHPRSSHTTNCHCPCRPHNSCFIIHNIIDLRRGLYSQTQTHTQKPQHTTETRSSLSTRPSPQPCRNHRSREHRVGWRVLVQPLLCFAAAGSSNTPMATGWQPVFTPHGRMPSCYSLCQLSCPPLSLHPSVIHFVSTCSHAHTSSVSCHQRMVLMCAASSPGRPPQLPPAGGCLHMARLVAYAGGFKME